MSALAWFLVGRVLVGFTWRDEALVGLLNVEQTLALGLLLVAVLAYAMWFYTRGKVAA